MLYSYMSTLKKILSNFKQKKLIKMFTLLGYMQYNITKLQTGVSTIYFSLCTFLCISSILPDEDSRNVSRNITTHN